MSDNTSTAGESGPDFGPVFAVLRQLLDDALPGGFDTAHTTVIEHAKHTAAQPDCTICALRGMTRAALVAAAESVTDEVFDAVDGLARSYARCAPPTTAPPTTTAPDSGASATPQDGVVPVDITVVEPSASDPMNPDD